MVSSPLPPALVWAMEESMWEVAQNVGGMVQAHIVYSAQRICASINGKTSP